MAQEKKVKTKKSFRKTLMAEWRSIHKPTKDEQIKGTFSTFGIAMPAAWTISAFDSVFTAFVGLFV